jgi:hypothetical protein
MLLPIAARFAAYFARLIDHTDPEATFKTTVHESMVHLENRIEEVAKGALPTQTDANISAMGKLVTSLNNGLEEMRAKLATAEQKIEHLLTLTTAPADEAQRGTKNAAPAPSPTPSPAPSGTTTDLPAAGGTAAPLGEAPAPSGASSAQ